MPLDARSADLVSALSTRLSGVALDQIDAEVDRALEEIVDCLGSDRASFIELSAEDGMMVLTHSRARPGVDPVPLGRTFIGRWYQERLRQGESLRLARLPDDLPAEAGEVRDFTVALSMRSHLAVPLSVGGRWVCALVTATTTQYRSWSDLDVARLREFGQLLATAIHRRNLERELRETLSDLRTLQNSAQQVPMAAIAALK